MRYVEFTESGWTRPGLLLDERVIDMSILGSPATLTGWLQLRVDQRSAMVAQASASAIPSWPVASVHLHAPVSHPSKIIAVGLNYRDHCREQGVAPPTSPLLFGKFPSTLIGPTDMITWDPELTQQVDPEVELGVVIGQRCRRVAVEHALEAVFGYTVVNDVSARDLQFGDGQWTRGKNLDTFCPIGPTIVTADEIPDPQSLRLQLWVDDHLRQEGSTSDMIFSVAEIIAHISHYMTLEPGDLILTGTPWGVGCFRTPPIYLHGDETVRCTIAGIGTLANPTRLFHKETV